MKKKSFTAFCFLIMFSAFCFAQEELDDFDSIFDNASDLEEPVPEVTSSQENQSDNKSIMPSAFSSIVHFSGNFDGEVGVAYIYNEENTCSGMLALKNVLNMSVIPSEVFSVRGSLLTELDNDFAAEVKSLYFDYLFVDHIYISGGKKKLSWGYTNIFRNSSYYGCDKITGGFFSTGPLYTNIFDEDPSSLCVEVRYPWTTGTITFVATADASEEIGYKYFNYYGSFEISVLNTSINLFGKYPNQENAENKNSLAGLEVKRTILGYDVYAQGIARFKDAENLSSESGYDYITGTAGFYRLFDSFDPNIGFNFEYQYEFNPDTEDKFIHRVALEGGLRRIGKKKNVKVGVMSHYNITEEHGYSGLNFIISGLFPYADWSNKMAVGYGEKYKTPLFLIGTSLKLALKY